jgi:hypothetical protein
MVSFSDVLIYASKRSRHRYVSVSRRSTITHKLNTPISSVGFFSLDTSPGMKFKFKLSWDVFEEWNRPNLKPLVLVPPAYTHLRITLFSQGNRCISQCCFTKWNMTVKIKFRFYVWHNCIDSQHNTMKEQEATFYGMHLWTFSWKLFIVDEHKCFGLHVLHFFQKRQQWTTLKLHFSNTIDYSSLQQKSYFSYLQSFKRFSKRGSNDKDFQERIAHMKIVNLVCNVIPWQHPPWKCEEWETWIILMMQNSHLSGLKELEEIFTKRG